MTKERGAAGRNGRAVRAIVVGGLGFIGSRLVEMASEQGIEVLVLDSLTYAGSTENLQPQCRWQRCDLNNGWAVALALKEFRPDCVVNLAAETHVTRSLESQEAFVRTNVAGVNVLLNCCLDYWREQGEPGHFRLLQASTDEVYGSLQDGEPPWSEESPLRPNNPYAASKAAGEMLARSFFRTFGLPVVVTRGCNVFGPRQHPEKALPTFCLQLFGGHPVTLHGDGLHVREWLHVDDHCRGLLAAALGGEPGAVYNLAGGTCLTSYELAMRLAKAAGHAQLWVTQVPDRLGNDRRYQARALKAAKELGWYPQAGQLDLRIEEAVAWYRAAYERRYQDGYGR